MGDILDHLHKYNSLIHLLYDRMKIDKEDLSDRTKRNIHRFIDFSLPLVSFAASDFLIEKRTLKQGTFGVSINYYPSGLDRRFLFIRGNEVLRCFINNNNIGYNEISAFFHNNSIGIDYEEIVNFIEQLFVLNTDLNKELNRYFTDIDNLNSANNEAKTYFSLMSYFNDSIYNHNKNVSFECDKPLTYENFRETYKYAYNQKVDYTQYHKLLQTISWGNQNNDSAINDNNNETRYNIYSFAVGDYYDNRKYANILLFSVEKIDIDSIVIEQLKLIFTVFMSQITNLESTYRSCRQVYTYRNKSAITSILVDSFAHNISAHSLASLKWWFELRHRMMDRRFQIGDNGTELKCINPCQLHITKDRLGKTIEEYYCALGLQDSTYNKEHASLLDIIHFYSQCKNGLDKEETGKKELELMQWESSVIIKEDSHFHPRFPVSLDYALFPYFRFLRDKGAFWSGVTRDMTFGGESKTWYKILWEDFANNPLYLGTIAKSEEIAKINIHLSVQDMREKSQDNGSRVKGNFVTIDLSIMDDEEDWVNSKKRVQAIDQDEGKYINAGKYSKYAFVKLGRCFPVFREILNDEDNYRVFLPGGIVGEHALFTIIENTLRNIKHYTDDSDAIKSIRKNGIDLWISIDKESIRIGNESKEAIICDKKSQLFKVGVWLEHLTDIYEKDEVTDEEKKEVKTDKPTDEANKTDDQFIENYLLINIAEMTCEQIIDESTGSPRMGGNSQDKICAAMLFNNTFSSTETRKDTKRDSKYYPWIDFAIKPECFELEDKLDIRPDTPIEEKEKQIEDYKKLVDGRESKRGYLKRYFHLWRGEDYIVVRNESDFEAENLSRFKIVVIPQKDKTGKVLDCYHRNNLIKKAKNAGVVRIIYDIDVPDDDKLDVKELYAKWIRNLLGLKDGTAHKMNLKLGSEGGNESTLGSFIIASDRFIYCGNHKSAYKKYLGDQYPNCIIAYTGAKKEGYVILAHGSSSPKNREKFSNVRSHGWFLSDLFQQSKGNLSSCANYPETVNPQDNEFGVNLYPNDSLKIYEFIETVLTGVVIFDKRVYQRIQKNQHGTPLSLYQNQLGLLIQSEDAKEFESFVQAPTAVLPRVGFLVIHLSFIESIGYREKDINQFVKKMVLPIRGIFSSLVLVITTGRGRDSWWDILDEKYKEFTIFKPIESLLTAIESGVSYNDDIDIKYNIIKVLFGS